MIISMHAANKALVRMQTSLCFDCTAQLGRQVQKIEMDLQTLKLTIISAIGQYPFFVLGFYIILKMLGVSDSLFKRSLFRSSLYAGLLIVIALLLFILVPILINWTPLLATIAFVVIIPRYLILKNWQAVIIPFGIYVFGNLGVALILMLIFEIYAN